jgi:ABC-2 type transport system permease protein
MSWRGIWAIARKDMLIVRRSRPMFYPLIAISILLLIFLPLSVTMVAMHTGAAPGVMEQWDILSQRFPGDVAIVVDSGFTDAQQMVLLINVYLLAPFYLLIPLLLAMVIAADTFAGEKERRTLEALLYTPMTDLQLLVGKLLASWIPAVVVSIIGVVLYGVILNITAWPLMGEIFFPTPLWIVLVTWLGPAVAGLGLGAMVLVSSRVETLQEATQLGGGVVLPFVLLIVGQATGVLYLSTLLVIILGAGLWMINALILLLAVRTFRRETLLLDKS